MFVGHALLAFAVAAFVADWRGWTARDALLVGAVAGAFAALPDVDVVYALVGLVRWVTLDGAVSAPVAFWDASQATHRSVTHSLYVGAIAAPAFGLVALWGHANARRLAIPGSIVLFGVLGVTAFVGGGPLATLVLTVFLTAGVVVTRASERSTTLSPTTIALAALWGLWSHPWGDLVTGTPPDWAFPFEEPFLSSRVVLHQDPTLHLLGAFAVELAVVWFALLTVYRLTDRPVISAIDPGASVGVLYGVAALVATPPTLSVSYHFVYSILGVGFVSGVVRAAPVIVPGMGFDRVLQRGLPSTDGLLEGALTALAGITIALLTYTASYLLVGRPF